MKTPLTPDEIKIKREKRMEERKDNDIKVVLKIPEGRRLYRRLMAEAGLWLEPMVMGYQDATHYNLGRLSVGRSMLADILRADPSSFEQMNREFASEAKRIEDEDKESEKDNDILTTS